MSVIYFVRHGENRANITKEFSYKDVDYSLTERGIVQSQQTADFFIHEKIDYIYSSPLKRAYETADIIASKIGLKNSIIEDFREMNVGSLEKPPVTEESWETFHRIMDEWNAGNFDLLFPDGENYRQMLQRMRSGIEKVLKNRNSSIIVVAHGGIISSSIEHICSNMVEISISLNDNNNCSITKVDFSDSLTGKLIYWAKSDHISGPAGNFEPVVPDR